MKRAALLLVVAAAAACGRKAEVNGIGPYNFAHTTRAAVHDGVCQPTELTDGRKATWCFALPPIKVGKRVAEVDAYFLGQEPQDSAAPEARKAAQEKLPLIEVQLKVRGCVESEAEQWMRERFGPPDMKQTRGALEVWQNHFIWAGALLPSEPGRCLIHLLPLSEAAEIARIKAKAAGGDSPSGNSSGSAAGGGSSGSAAGSAQ